jgi:prevent-host-death family protein
MRQAVSKSQFKARALEYFRQVEKNETPLIVTHHRRPVIKIVPDQPDVDQLLRNLRGSLVFYKDHSALSAA